MSRKLFLHLLDDERRRVWDKLLALPQSGILGGGTALALQIGHRYSYDFDVFYPQPIKKNYLAILRRIFGDRLERVVVDTTDELTVILKPEMKLTLLYYPLAPRHHPFQLPAHLPIFDLCDIASSKAYAIGRRGVWRDYVDIFFIMRDHFSLSQVITETVKRFGSIFSPKLFLEQLLYTKDLGPYVIEFVDERISEKQLRLWLKLAVDEYLRVKLR